MRTIRIVGDVHGKQGKYIEIVKDSEYSLQLGDMGFQYDQLSVLDAKRHKFIYGNHDNQNSLYGIPHSIKGQEKWVFAKSSIRQIYVPGGLSIDKNYRIDQIDWWHNEELSYSELTKMVKTYEKVKPDIVFSHECPASIIKYVCSNSDISLQARFGTLLPSRTAKFLDIMFEFHQPKYWFFGHFHKNWTKIINKTEFRCLDELSFFDLEI